MRTWDIVLYVVAAVLFSLAMTSFVPEPLRTRCIAGGLLAATLVPLIALINT